MISGASYGGSCDVDVDGDCSETKNVCASDDKCVCSMSTFRTIENTCVDSSY